MPTFAANRFYKTEGTKIREKGSFPVVVRSQKRLYLSSNTCLTDLTGWMPLCIKESYKLELVFKSLILNSANVAYTVLSTRSARHA